MLCNGEVDGELVWITGGVDSGNPALILDSENGKYWVRLITISGDIVTQTRYDSLREALTKFIEALPLDA